jgi:hypothetical protein
MTSAGFAVGRQVWVANVAESELTGAERGSYIGSYAAGGELDVLGAADPVTSGVAPHRRDDRDARRLPGGGDDDGWRA